MKKLIGSGLLGIMLLSAPAFGGEQQVLKTQKDKENYSTGVEFVRTLKQQGGAINLDLVIQGIKDGLTGANLLMTEEDLRKTLADLKVKGPQDQAVNKPESLKTETAGKGEKADAAVPQKPEQRDEQGDQNGLLAAKQSAAVTAANAGRSNGSEVQQGQAAPNQRNEQALPLSPNGTALSKRNQAKLSVAEMKQEMRAAILKATGQ